MFGFGKKKRKQREMERATRMQQEEGTSRSQSQQSQSQTQMQLQPFEQREEPKKKGRLDSLVMGAIMGVAVGSVIGMAVAPRKNKEPKSAQKQEKRQGLISRIIFGRDSKTLKGQKDIDSDLPDVLKKIPTEATNEISRKAE